MARRRAYWAKRRAAHAKCMKTPKCKAAYMERLRKRRAYYKSAKYKKWLLAYRKRLAEIRRKRMMTQRYSLTHNVQTVQHTVTKKVKSRRFIYKKSPCLEYINLSQTSTGKL